MEPKIRLLFKVNVRIGDHDLLTDGDTTIEKTIAVTNIFNHENYNPSSCLKRGLKSHDMSATCLNNDITLLELAEEVDINIYTPACLAQTSDKHTFCDKIAQVSAEFQIY